MYKKLVSKSLFLEAQIEHLRSCASCRMLLSLFDFHCLGKAHQSLATNFLVLVLMDGIKAFKNKVYIVNQCPFINEHNELDPMGGLFISGGKGSHSFTVGNDGFARMRANAGLRNGTIFTLMAFLTPQNCARGEFHVSFSKFYEDAGNYITDFSANGGSRVVRDYWELSAKAILRLLRFTPTNLHPDEQLSIEEKKVNRHLFATGKLCFVEVDDFTGCTANQQIKECLKAGVNLENNIK